jgi:imidazolonepropionase-like amidohydrolase
VTTDFHVHLDLVDATAVSAGGLTRVVDLGSAVPHHAVAGVEVVTAGKILTARGGYPSDRPWAAGGLFREVGQGDVDAAVAEQVASGASLIKIALNTDQGPVWPDDLLREVVGTVHAAGLRCVAHVQGAGEAARAADAGLDAFAHTPWSEHLDDALITHLAASTTWISTLRIHRGRDQQVAVANARKFHAAGGRILYGTDMGNGPSTGGVEDDELALLQEAGLSDDDLAAALGDSDV